MDPDAGLPPEIAALRRTAREFADRELRPRVEEMEARQHIPDDLVALMGEVGFFGLPFPPEWGGAGLGAHTLHVPPKALSQSGPASAPHPRTPI